MILLLLCYTNFYLHKKRRILNELSQLRYAEP